MVFTAIDLRLARCFAHEHSLVMQIIDTDFGTFDANADRSRHWM